MNMITPKQYFTADEIRFIQQEAEVWIEKVNTEIISAAEQGLDEVRIQVTESDWMKASRVIKPHFKNRGFAIEWDARREILISWDKSYEYKWDMSENATV